MPKTAFIIVTSKCNHNCHYCFYQQDAFRQKEDKFTSQNLIKLIKDLKAHNFNEITFTGGEPLLKKQFLIKGIRKASQLGFIVNLDTNGTLLNEKLIKKLRSAGLTKIYLSGQYIQSLPANILDPTSRLLPIVVIHVITKENLKNLKKIIDITQKLSIKLIVQPAYIKKSYQYFDKLSTRNLNNQQWIYFKKTLKHWGEKSKKQKYVNLILAYYKNKKFAYPKNCHMGVSDIVVDSDGSVFPCFHRQDLLAGNIFQKPFEDILSKIKIFSKKTRNAACFGEYCLSLFYN